MSFGAARVGHVMVPIGWRLAEPEAAFILDNAEAKALVLGDGFEGCAATLGQRPGLKACLAAPVRGPLGRRQHPDAPDPACCCRGWRWQSETPRVRHNQWARAPDPASGWQASRHPRKST